MHKSHLTAALSTSDMFGQMRNTDPIEWVKHSVPRDFLCKFLLNKGSLFAQLLFSDIGCRLQRVMARTFRPIEPLTSPPPLPAYPPAHCPRSSNGPSPTRRSYSSAAACPFLQSWPGCFQSGLYSPQLFLLHSSIHSSSNFGTNWSRSRSSIWSL